MKTIPTFSGCVPVPELKNRDTPMLKKTMPRIIENVETFLNLLYDMNSIDFIQTKNITTASCFTT